MKTLLIVGEFDSDNVGDQLIGEGQALLFANADWNVITSALEPVRVGAAISSSPAARRGLRSWHRKLYQQSVWYRHAAELASFAWKQNDYARHARGSLDGVDCLVVGGGQLLSDGTLRMMKRLLSLANEAKRRQIPIAAFGTGVSMPRTLVSRLFLRAILGKLDSMSWFRDDASLTIAREYANGDVLANSPVPDCAIPRIASLAETVSVSTVPRTVGVAPMSAASLKLPDGEVLRSDAWWVEVISLLLSRGYRPVLFCSGVLSDYHRCMQIQQQASGLGLDVELMKRPENSRKLIELVAGMEHVLSQRLHVSIARYSAGLVPTSVGWDLKVEHFFQGVGLERRVVQPAVTPEHAVEVLLLDEQPTIHREQLAERCKQEATDCLQCLGSSVGPRNA